MAYLRETLDLAFDNESDETWPMTKREIDLASDRE